MSTKTELVVGSIAILIILIISAIEYKTAIEKAQVKGCKAVIIRRLKQSGAEEILKSSELDSTLQAYCSAVIKNQ